MRWSKYFLYTLREKPSDAEVISHQLLVRGNYIRKLSSGVFTYSPLGLRSIRKLEAIIREEHDRKGCVEILMPMVQPKEIWEETGRWDKLGDVLLKLKDRNNQDHCLGGTHEEVITDYIRKDIKSYRDLPVILYQIQTKFRNEIRPRFGLMRGREFLMKDAYSFDVDKESALKSFSIMKEIYISIFKRLGIEFRSVSADSGGMGGDLSKEFHALASSGEDELMVSDKDDFAANIEACETLPGIEPETAPELKDKEEFATPNAKTIADLSKLTGMKPKELVKIFFVSISDKGFKPIGILLRGNEEVNFVKVKNYFNLVFEPRLLSDEEVKSVTGASPGSCGPVGLDIPIYMDHGLVGHFNYMVGANKDGFHLKNVNHNRDFKSKAVVDFRKAKAGDLNPRGKGKLKSIRGIEVGHIFYLGRFYSESMGLSYLDEQGKEQPVEMGSYGLGVTRTLQAIIEQSHDKDGIIWPASVAPFHVHICHLDPQDEKSETVVSEIEKSLTEKGIDIFIDDRKERPGVKFKDADLLGMPVRLNIGCRGVSSGEIEVIHRKTKNVHKVSIDKVVSKVSELLELI